MEMAVCPGISRRQDLCFMSWLLRLYAVPEWLASFLSRGVLTMHTVFVLVLLTLRYLSEARLEQCPEHAWGQMESVDNARSSSTIQ